MDVIIYYVIIVIKSLDLNQICQIFMLSRIHSKKNIDIIELSN